jgi:nucleoside-triphosphatase THEP1
MYQKYLPFVRPALWVFGISVGGFIAWNVLKKGKRIGRQIVEKTEFDKEQKEKLSYPKTQYKAWADSLEKT